MVKKILVLARKTIPERTFFPFPHTAVLRYGGQLPLATLN